MTNPSCPNPSDLSRKASKVKSDDAGMRLDRWFKRGFPEISHGQIQKFLRTGQIRVDGKRAEASDRLVAGQEIRIPPMLGEEDKRAKLSDDKKSKINQSRAEKIKNLVLFQDDDVVVLNKPAGLAVQGGTGLRENLDDLLIALSKDGKTKPKLVHRLDRDTSGVLLVARTDYAARQLTASFRDRETKKIYWALTAGVPKPESGKINAPLLKQGEVMVVCDDPENEEAKSAITLYQIMETALKKAAFVALWPITGRTHQLRIHLAHLGTPIYGDRLYGGDKVGNLPAQELGKGLHLHARRLIIPHPRRGMIDVSAPLSGEMKKTWRWFNFDTQTETDFD